MAKSQISFLIPEHVSSKLPPNALYLRVHRAGIVWHELAPILLRAPPKIVAKLLRLILRSSKRSLLKNQLLLGNDVKIIPQEENTANGESSDGESEPYPGFRHRSLYSRNLPSFTMVVVPPSIVNEPPNATFLSVVLRTEHQMLKFQTMSAILSTLGGGYFFCKHLSLSLQMARQQRALAIKLKHVGMIRQCTVNEAYNLIYAGRFAEAKRVLTQLEASLEGTGDETTKNQCKAARLFAKRLKQVATNGTLERYNPNDRNQSHTVDDYQRIRIVVA